jgi:hypothetical protein
MLDEQLRQRIRGLAEADESSFDDAARERILTLIREEGPSLVQSARRRRFFVGASAVGAVAAGFALLFALRQPGDLATAKVESGTKAGAALACASRTVPDSAKAGFVTGNAGARLDLGAVALAAALPGAVVHLEEASPCSTIIALDSGTVAVHAKDLGGGELRVRTTRGDVVVHGTIFAVTRDETSLAVEVVVGKVSVTDRDDTHSVTTGQRLLLSTVGAAEGPLEAPRAAALRATLGISAPGGAEATEALPAEATRERVAAPVPAGGQVVAASRGSSSRTEEPSKGVRPVPEVTLEPDEAAEPAPTAPSAPVQPTDPLAMAEQARRAGDYGQARELYRRAAEGTGATAEAAWVALARMELSLGHSAQARQATKQRQERFGRGTLSPEALWIDVRSYRQSGDLMKARELASQLVEHWPSSPQARAAEQWLSAH